MSRSRQSKQTPRTHVGTPGIPGVPAMDAGSIPPEYRRAFSILAFTMNRFIVDHVMRAARLFDNDTEALILFGMLAHLNIVHLLPPGSSPGATLDSQGRVPDSQANLRPVRVRDLAQITGRPRETIRRKLEQMRAAGRVLRLRNGWVYDVSSIDPDMQALTLDSVRRFLQAADVMRSAAQDAALTAPADAAAPRGSAATQRRRFPETR